MPLRFLNTSSKSTEYAKLRVGLTEACYRMACSGMRKVQRALELNAKIYAGDPHGLTDAELEELAPYMKKEAGRAGTSSERGGYEADTIRYQTDRRLTLADFAGEPYD